MSHAEGEAAVAALKAVGIEARGRGSLGGYAFSVEGDRPEIDSIVSDNAPRAVPIFDE